MEANNEDEMSSFDDLDETKAKRKLHAYYDKEEKAKSKIQKTKGFIFDKKTAKKKRKSTKAVQ